MEFRLIAKPRKDSNKCLAFAIPYEESRELDPKQSYEVTIKGPVREIKNSRFRIVVKFR